MKKKSAANFPAAFESELDAQELRRLWEVLPEPEATRSPDETDAAWDALSRQLGLSATDAVSPAASTDAPAVVPEVRPLADRAPTPTLDGGTPLWRRAGMRAVLRAAATVVLALGVTGGWYAVPVSQSAGAGEQREITLPDGSAVTLNAGSSLSWRRSFAWLPGVPATARAVKLQGEAFFSVTPGVRPFRVQTEGVDVRVLGTRFNVRARVPGSVRVDVEEGRVQVTPDADARSLILRAGEAATLDADSGSLTPSTVDLPRVGAWRSGGLVLENEPLIRVLTELSLRYDTPVTLADGVDDDARLNLYYATVSSLESVVSDLAIQQGLRYRATRSGWELF